MDQDEVLQIINECADQKNGKPFRLSGRLLREGEVVGLCFFSDNNVGGYTLPTIDLAGDTVAVGMENENLFIFSRQPVVIINTTETGWREKLRSSVSISFENPGRFTDYELGGRHNEFGH